MISPLSVEHELVKVPFVTFEETGRVGYCSFHTLLPANHYLAIVAATEPQYFIIVVHCVFRPATGHLMC